MLAVDWKRVRETLRELRLGRGWDVPELADEAGLAKTTVYRVEDLTNPGKAVDLDTVERITTALGLSLSDFFIRVQQLPSRIGSGKVDSAHPTPATASLHQVSIGERPSVSRPLDDPRNILLAANNAALVQLARSVDALGDALRVIREQAATPRATRPGRPVRDRKRG